MNNKNLDNMKTNFKKDNFVKLNINSLFCPDIIRIKSVDDEFGVVYYNDIKGNEDLIGINYVEKTNFFTYLKYKLNLNN